MSARRDIVTKYEALDKHPEGLFPPYPCNRWCKKVISTHEGKVIEEIVMPWLDECKGKQIAVGVRELPAGLLPNTSLADPIIFRPHLGFDEINYVVMEEKAFKYDDDGNIVNEKNESGDDVPVADFTYVAGINTENFIAEHVFRIAAVVSVQGKQTMGALNALNNNLVQLCKMQSFIIKQQYKEESSNQIEMPQDQTSLPKAK